MTRAQLESVRMMSLATRDDLRTISNMFHARRTELDGLAMMAVSDGDLVEFDKGRGDVIITGTVVGRTKTGKLKVKAPGNVTWTVPAALCRKVTST